MTRQYRFIAYVVEGTGSNMRTVEVASATTPTAAGKKLIKYRQENGIGPKRTGIFDRKRKRWHDMPAVLA